MNQTKKKNRFLTEPNTGKKYTLRKGTDIKIYPYQDNTPSKCRTEFTDECNINKIMETYKKTGIEPKLRPEGIFGDYANLPEYDEARSIIIQADDAFNQLPSETRSYFENSPQNLVNFLQNKENKEKAIELGLIDKPKTSPLLEDPPQPEPRAPKGGGKPKEPEPTPEK